MAELALVPPNPGARLVAIVAAVAVAFLSSCASRPASPNGSTAPARPGSIAASRPASSPRKSPASSPTRDAYLEAALSEYWSRKLPNGATLAIKRQAGRTGAAARIVLARDIGDTDARKAGYAALALWTAASGSLGSEPGSVARALRKAGGTLELRLDDFDDVALELRCPSEEMAGLLDLVARALAAPAFATEDFDLALREARVSERRESGDPLLRAAAELRAGLYPDGTFGLSPRGTAASLAAATRTNVMRYWSERFDPARLSIVVVGDFETENSVPSIAGPLESSFAAVPGASLGSRDLPRTPTAPELRTPTALEQRTPTAPAAPLRPWFKAIAFSGMPRQAVLRADFGAPAPSSPDFPAMSVALTMLDDLLLDALRGNKGGAHGAWTGLRTAPAPSASIIVYKTGDPSTAKAAVDGAIAAIARGLCLDTSSSGDALAPLARGLDAYKSRALAAIYGKSASSEGMAAKIARDLASGGDGTAMFRMASRIGAVQAADVVRVAKRWLLDAPAAWVALGDPDLVLRLSPTAFALRDNSRGDSNRGDGE